MSITSDIIRGHTEAIILSHLMEGDSYGYQINRISWRRRTAGMNKRKPPCTPLFEGWSRQVILPLTGETRKREPDGGITPSPRRGEPPTAVTSGTGKKPKSSLTNYCDRRGRK